MILRPTVTRDPFATTYTVDPERYPAPRHRAARPRSPGSIWTLWTMVLWAGAGCTTLVSAVTFGPVFTPLMLGAILLYVAGIVTFVTGWGRWESDGRD